MTMCAAPYLRGMPQPFTIQINWKNEILEFDGELREMGFTYKIAIQVEDVEVLFEPDEERNFRAVIPAEIPFRKTPDMNLLKDIAAELERNLK